MTKASSLRIVRRRWLLLSAFGMLLSAVGCIGSQSPSEVVDAQQRTYQGSYPIRATVTVGMVADLVRVIGGEHVKVTQLMGSGVDPHLYKPSSDDVRAILGSDIVLTNGLMLEGKMAELLERSAQSRPTCVVGSRLKLPADIAGADPHHPDPHVWMDVSLWQQAVGVVGQFLQDFDPPHAQEYAARMSELSQRLDRLHNYGRTVIGSIPEPQRVLITSHDAFRYFGKAYGLEVQAVQGISTESEAGLQRINELVDLIVTRKIKAAFVESSVPQKSIEALLEGARQRGQTIEIGGELFSDAMGPEGTYEGTYVGMMDHNLTTVAVALGASQVPDDGFKSLEPAKGD
ncbi:MAG: zinc ABC transporter substrate-binding protein [Pirellulaceae bacterium]|nr:zinc ABC transporter substrate-binding protein [Pirellulaceae bacterium]